MTRRKPTVTLGPDLDLDAEIINVNDKRLTEVGAQMWAAELEARDRSNDRSRANLIPGRKSLSGGGRHSPVVNVRVSEATRGRLDEIAAQRGVSVSRIAREAIDAYIGNTG
jgi:predicted HicB family RNase H-like nuclease